MAQNTAVLKMKSEIVNNVKSHKAPVYELIDQLTEKFGVLPSGLNAEKLTKIAMTTIRLNPKLANCTPMSLLGAIFQAAQLGLEPNTEGQAYIIPYYNTIKKDGKKVKVLEAQFQIGYKGYVELFYRHANSTAIDMHTVYKNDLFECEYGSNAHIKHCPSFSDRGEVLGYYAIARTANGGSIFKFMRHDECINHAKEHSKCYITMKYDENLHKYVSLDKPYFDPNSPWVTDTKAMCKKTVLIQLAKLLPKSVEIQRAIAMDNTTKSVIKADMFSVPDETNWKAENEALPSFVADGKIAGE